MKSLIRVQLLVTPWTVAYQAPPSMGFTPIQNKKFKKTKNKAAYKSCFAVSNFSLEPNLMKFLLCFKDAPFWVTYDLPVTLDAAVILSSLTHILLLASRTLFSPGLLPSLWLLLLSLLCWFLLIFNLQVSVDLFSPSTLPFLAFISSSLRPLNAIFCPQSHPLTQPASPAVISGLSCGHFIHPSSI